jgi:hypothetical protein
LVTILFNVGKALAPPHREQAEHAGEWRHSGGTTLLPRCSHTTVIFSAADKTIFKSLFVLERQKQKDFNLITVKH